MANGMRKSRCRPWELLCHCRERTGELAAFLSSMIITFLPHGGGGDGDGERDEEEPLSSMGITLPLSQTGGLVSFF